MGTTGRYWVAQRSAKRRNICMNKFAKVLAEHRWSVAMNGQGRMIQVIDHKVNIK